jgi:hypothetical protein
MGSVSIIQERISAGVARIVESSAFREWFGKQKKVVVDDLVVINNSFIYRDRVKTNKNKSYLCLNPTDAASVDIQTLAVTEPAELKIDFKLVSHKAGLPSARLLEDVISEELHCLGSLVFLLIGAIDDTQSSEVEIKHSVFSMLKFDPSATELVAIEGSVKIVTNRLDDPELLWEGVKAEALKVGLIETELPDDLEAPFAQSFSQLQAESFSVVHIPTESSDASVDSILGKIATNLQSQIDDYDASLNEYEKDPSKRAAFNDVLRISHNFASDATKLIELIISVCDIKPIVLWCTIAEHYQAADAFRSLPWARTEKKPSLAKYETMISRARNRAFHNLFPFERSLEVDVSGFSLRPRHLRFFPPYAGSRKKIEALDYEDKEIVDVLSEFTRAPETAVSLSFWRRNLNVMKATVDLINATQSALSLLRGASQ